MDLEDYQVQKQNRAIQQFLSDHPLVKQANYYITVAFPRGRYGPLYRRYAEDARRMVSAYARILSITCHGRERKTVKNQVLFVGWPEDKTKSGEPTFLHYHILCQFPEDRQNELEEITYKYWMRVCSKSPHILNPSINIKPAYNSSGAANYSCKNTSLGLTIEYMVMSGLSKNG